MSRDSLGGDGRWSRCRHPAGPVVTDDGGTRPDGAGCNTNSPSPSSPPTVTMAGCSPMLLTHDPSTAATELAAGVLPCPSRDCSGRLGPWGHARQRVLRLGSGQSEAHTPRRARCRRCGGTHVIVPARSYPRRPDTAEVVGTALVAASRGLGHRRVAELVELPATTVRGWLRRARANSEAVRVVATGPYTPSIPRRPRWRRRAVRSATCSTLSVRRSPPLSAVSAQCRRRGSSRW